MKVYKNNDEIKLNNGNTDKYSLDKNNYLSDMSIKKHDNISRITSNHKYKSMNNFNIFIDDSLVGKLWTKNAITNCWIFELKE